MPGSRDGAPVPPLVSAIADPAAIVDAEGRVVAWNDAAERLGIAGPDVAGRAPSSLANAADWAGSVRLDLADGGTLLVWPLAATVGDDELARQKARILERLAPGVAHDLINQVGGIRSFLQVMGGDEADRALLEDSATKALGTVTAFQELVRTRRTGAVGVAPARLIADALAMAVHPLHEVAVTVDVAEGLPDVLAEPGDLRVAVLALVINALDALGWPVARGALRVEAREAGQRVEISLEDDAAGIPGSALPRLFDPRPPREAGRAPLDLAVARHLVRQAGGDLRAEVVGVRGNRFVLELPVASAAPVPATEAPPATPGGTRPAAEPFPAEAESGGASVLVCDDDDAIRALIVKVLRRDGMDAVGAATGEAALAVLAERPVALMVADHHLGAMSGLDLYRRAVDLQPGLRDRFVLVSGDAGDGELVAFVREHGLRVVEKPFDVNDLARLIRAAATA